MGKIGQYSIVKTIKKGVFLCKRKKRFFVLKAFADIDRGNQEYRILRVLARVPHVVRVIDYFNFKRRAILVLVYIEPIKLSLLSRLERLKLAKTVIATLSKIHDLGIAHRDIKLDNIVISKQDRMPYFIDFEKSIILVPDELQDDVVGTVSHMSPELAIHYKKGIIANYFENYFCWKKNDLWGAGIVCYRILYDGAFPFRTYSLARGSPLTVLIKMYKTKNQNMIHKTGVPEIDSKLQIVQYMRT